MNALTLSLLMLAGASLNASAANLQEVRWNELAPLVSGKRVQVSLVDGSRVKGEALAIRDDVLVMDIRGSSGPTRFSKGQGSVPRAQVSLFKVERQKGALGRVLGTVGGALGGMTLGAYTVFSTDMGGGQALGVFTAIVLGATTGGYYLGNSLDRRTTTIKVVP